jgi:hypothetical protein
VDKLNKRIVHNPFIRLENLLKIVVTFQVFKLSYLPSVDLSGAEHRGSTNPSQG